VYEIDGQFGLSKGFQIEFRFLANVERWTLKNFN
jgi:hypothetical protein